jgi:hypothetical protein
VVTAARLRLVPQSPERVVTLLAFSSTCGRGRRGFPPAPGFARPPVARILPQSGWRWSVASTAAAHTLPRSAPAYLLAEVASARSPPRSSRGARIGGRLEDVAVATDAPPEGPAVALPRRAHRGDQHARRSAQARRHAARAVLASFIDRVPDVVRDVDPRGRRPGSSATSADGNVHVNVTGVEP